MDIVFACRAGKYGISDIRANIEKFELFLLSSKYGVYLPDGQCGCWGFKTDILEKIPLIAKSFEIELDLLSACLRNRIFLHYMYAAIEGDDQESEFNPKDHEKKLSFLIERLEWNREFVFKRYGEYAKEHGELPEGYVELLRTIDWPDIPVEKENQFNHFIPTYKLLPGCLKRCDIIECVCSSTPSLEKK